MGYVFIGPMRTGAPFFLLKDGLTGRQQNQTVCMPARFLFRRPGATLPRFGGGFPIGGGTPSGRDGYAA